MEKLNHLYTIMYKFYFWNIICLGLTIGLTSCNNQASIENNAYSQINGAVEVLNDYWSQPNGVKIILTNQFDTSIKHVAVTGSDGLFNFYDIEEGIYSIEAVKEGFRWIWMVDDGVVNHRDNLIQLIAGETKEISILLESNSSSSLTFNLKLTDVNGNPIDGSLKIPKYATTVAFKLYNGTDKRHSWSVESLDHCFVSDDRGIKLEYIFDDFTPMAGTLAPGNNAVLVGTINQKIWSVYTNRPYYVYNTMDIYSGITHQSITLKIDF